MKNLFHWVALSGLAIFSAPSHATQAIVNGCETLTRLTLRHVSIVHAERTRSGHFIAPDHTGYDLPATCRVSGEARPTPDSRIAFEVWLPAQGWTGRFYQLGSGGFAGSINYPSLAAQVRAGNAVAATDAGHHGNGFDASWALGHPQRIIDYGYRSLKQTSDASAAVIRAFYGRSSDHRYFAGCSNGGRQALMAAQRFPMDWDGIIAGAPAADWTRQLATFAWLQQALRANPQTRITVHQLPLIARAALASCSVAARVADGIPGDPRACPFDPATLLCKDQQTDECLTADQVHALQNIQNGPHDSRTGEPIYSGFEPTSAAAADNWDRWILGSNPAIESQRTFAEQYFRYFVFSDPDWAVDDFRSTDDFDLAQAHPIATESLTRVLDAKGSELAGFRRQGGKLLIYVGWDDAVISPRSVFHYYDDVVASSGGIDEARRFARLIPVPGMTHCQGGPGPNAFGQALIAPTPSDDAEHDIFLALEAWVERGIAPTGIIATKYIDDEPARGIARTSVLCASPQIPADSSGDAAIVTHVTCINP